MIVGVGLDVTELSRIQRLLRRYGDHFICRILSEREKSFLPAGETGRILFLAGRFAAKEAFSKALGTGFTKDIIMPDISVLPNTCGAPQICASGGAYRHLQALGAERIWVSITHGRDIAAASVVLERRE